MQPNERAALHKQSVVERNEWMLLDACRTEILPSRVSHGQLDMQKNHTADHRSSFSSIGMILFFATRIHIYIYISFDNLRLSVDVLGKTGACPGGVEPGHDEGSEERETKKKKGTKREEKTRTEREGGGRNKVRKKRVTILL